MSDQQGITRRGFIKNATVAGAAAATAGVLGAASAQAKGHCPTPWLPAKWDYEADVVICGYGSTGMPAAIEAYDAGVKDILILEQAAWLGGQGRRCGGGVAQAETVVQKKFGIVDSKDDFYKYLVACGEGLVDKKLLRSFANNDNVDWIIQKLGGQPVSEWSISSKIVPDDTKDKDVPLSFAYGLNYSGTPVFFSKYGMKLVMRCHWFTGDPAAEEFMKQHAGMSGQAGPNGGTGVFKTLDAAVKARKKIRTMASTSLAGFVAGPDREVLGIMAVGADNKTFYIKANRGVLIGTGGWAMNKSMVMNYLHLAESAFKPGKYPTSQAVETEEDGSGILAAQALGADTFLMGAGGGTTDTSQGFLCGSGGLKINDQSQVIDIYGKPIPRLYAGGRATGGIYFEQYPSCGIAFSSAIWQGRIAGKNLAALKSWGKAAVR